MDSFNFVDFAKAQQEMHDRTQAILESQRRFWRNVAFVWFGVGVLLGFGVGFALASL